MPDTKSTCKDESHFFSLIKKTIALTIASERIKCIRINLTKEVKGLYVENYKTRMKETIKKQKDTCIHGFMSLKHSHLPKAISRFSAIPIPTAFLTETEKKKFSILYRTTKDPRSSPEKEDNTEGIHSLISNDITKQ